MWRVSSTHVPYRSGVTRQHLESTTAPVYTPQQTPVTWRDGFGWSLLVMYWVCFLAVLLLSMQGYSAWRYALYPNHLPDNDDVSWIKRRDHRPTGTGISSAEQHMRRSVRRRRTVHTVNKATNFTFTLDFVGSTVNTNDVNTFVTHTVTNPLPYTEELPAFLDSKQTSYLLKATDGSTIGDDIYTTVDTGLHAAVKLINVSATESTMVESQVPTADGNEHENKPEANDTTNWICPQATSAMTNDTQVITSSDNMSDKIAKAIQKIAQPTTAVVGVFGNTISMLVMFQPNNRQTSFGIYLGMLAVSDTLALCISTAYWLSRLLSQSPLRDIDCQMIGWMMNSIQMFGTCLILGLTSDRLIAVRFPLKAAAWCDAKRARVVCGVIFVVVLIVNTPFAVYNHVENCNICAMGTPGSMVSLVYSWVSVCVGLVIPFVLLVTMNAVIAMGIRNRLRHCKYTPNVSSENYDTTEMRNNPAHSSEDLQENSSSNDLQITPMSSKERNAIVILFLISFTFLMLVTPHFVHIAIFSIINRAATAPSRHTSYNLFFQVSRLLYSMNNACNFFLYCVSGTKFRSEVVALFRGKVCTW